MTDADFEKRIRAALDAAAADVEPTGTLAGLRRRILREDNPPMSKAATIEERQLTAAIDLLGATGAAEVKLFYCDEEKPPLVWIAAGRWADRWEVAAAPAPLAAMFRLCDQVIDGGQCTHCNRPTGFSPDIDAMPLDGLVCWYQWDPELWEFRRGCAGSVP